ncbi:MAG: multicopper oxidase domain-containing protein [Desulfobacterales bacterium]|nr:MAG: multicopper oxidase domain-containing protein [Desulfobacterales bacterium]
MNVTRKGVKPALVIGVALLALMVGGIPGVFAEPLPGGTLDPTAIPKYVDPLVIPPAMPSKGIRWDPKERKFVRYYEIEVVEFDQQILPSNDTNGNTLNPTTVWSYAAVGRPATRNYPAFTIEAYKDFPVRVKWVNSLVDEWGQPLPHLLTVDQTLHWANPPQDCREGRPRTDCAGKSQEPYTGPVPIVTHVHGAHVGPESDGYPEAWYLPAGADPTMYATEGSNYSDYLGGSGAGKGFAVFQYPNDQPSTTLWYHDHTLGMTRSNVYAGPAGFYLIRDLRNARLRLPSPGLLPIPGVDPNGNQKVRNGVHEIPIVIQDRSFNADGSLFYPSNREFFEGLSDGTAFDNPILSDNGVEFAPFSDVAPLWNPEAFFNTMVVNGKTWPFLDVQKRKYRFRLLNGSNSRFLILRLATTNPASPSDPMNWVDLTDEFTQIGADQGFLPGAPAILDELLMGPAERADVIVDFSNFNVGDRIIMLNVGPDEPFGGGAVGVDFDPADAATSGQVMLFNVVPRKGWDLSRIPATLPPVDPVVVPDNVRQVSLNEEESATEDVCIDPDSEEFIDLEEPVTEEICAAAGGVVVPFGPTAALLGTVADGPLKWSEAITENPLLGNTETWEIYNNTVDGHPIHLHLVKFRVVNREILNEDSPNFPVMNIGDVRGPESWETGDKDTVIALPGEITRVQATFDIAGLYVWHCHILEHEDNEMMRAYYVSKDASDVPPSP